MVEGTRGKGGHDIFETVKKWMERFSVPNFIGPISLIPASRLVSRLFFRIPGDTLAQDKKRYPTLTRMSQFIPLDLNAFVSLVLLNYGYTSVGLLCDKNEDILDLLFRTCESLQDSLKPTYGINSSKKYVDIKAVNGTSLAAAILQEFVATTRGKMRRVSIPRQCVFWGCSDYHRLPRQPAEANYGKSSIKMYENFCQRFLFFFLDNLTEFLQLAAYDQGMVDGDYVRDLPEQCQR